MINGIIYKATNKVNGKVYIGQTSTGLDFRRKAHINNAKKNLESSIHFYRALNKHGEESFDWEVIDYTKDSDELNAKEIYWISHYDSYGDRGYNMTIGGQGFRGFKRSEENIEVIRNRMINAWENGHSKNMQKGSEHHATSLTEDDVLEIREKLIEGRMTIKEIALKFSVNTSVISLIKRGVNWKHIISEEDVQKTPSRYKRKFSERDVVEIKEALIKGGMTIKEIAKSLDVPVASVHNIEKGITHKNIITKEDLMKMNKIKKKRTLTSEEVIKIKLMLIEGVLSQVEISRNFNIDTATVSRIKSKRIWSHIQIPENENP